MSNAELARLLTLFADLQEIDGENRFKIRAYRTAAASLLELPEQVAAMVKEGEDLTTIPGVGKEIALKLTETVETGTFRQLDELTERIPAGLADVTRVKGIGPKLAHAAWTELGIDSVDALEAAARDGRLAGLPGFGPKRQAAVLDNVAAYRDYSSRALLGQAQPIIDPLVAVLRAAAPGAKIEVAGSYRRRRETIGDIDLVASASASAAEAITAAFVAYSDVQEVLLSGPTRSSVRLKNGLEVDLRVVEKPSYGAALLYFTGSKAHNIELRKLALEHGWHLTEYGLFEGTGDDGASPLSTGEPLAGATEAGIYEKLGLQFIVPELREGRGEVKAALAGELPRLIAQADIRGDLHMHSTWSDGRATVKAMVEACKVRGYEYMALTDHSKALAMTGGLDEDKLARQWRELDEMASGELGIELLRGMEVDILKDGSLDLGDEWLERLDIVLVSVHSHFGLSEAEQTARMIKAVSHPQVNILCHPTGRLLGAREGYAVDLLEVFDACAQNHVAVEVNASYHRLDLTDTNVMAARRLGLMVSIATDAHEVDELDNMQYGISQARRGWLTSEGTLNARTLAELRAFLAKR